MKILALLSAAIVVIAVACAVGPDLQRYMKIRAM